jgi:hypothetical protein
VRLWRAWLIAMVAFVAMIGSRILAHHLVERFIPERSGSTHAFAEMLVIMALYGFLAWSFAAAVLQRRRTARCVVVDDSAPARCSDVEPRATPGRHLTLVSGSRHRA